MSHASHTSGGMAVTTRMCVTGVWIDICSAVHRNIILPVLREDWYKYTTGFDSICSKLFNINGLMTFCKTEKHQLKHIVHLLLCALFVQGEVCIRSIDH